MALYLQALRHHSEVEELERNPNFPICDDNVLQVTLQLAFDVMPLALVTQANCSYQSCIKSSYDHASAKDQQNDEQAADAALPTETVRRAA